MNVCLNYKCQNKIELMCLNEMMFAKPIRWTSVLFVTGGILEMNFRFQSKVCNGCHDLMQKSMSFNDFANFC